MSSGIIICGIICVTIAIICLVPRKKKEKPFTYKVMATSSDQFYSTLTSLTQRQVDIVDVTFDYRTAEDIKYLIIYRETADE